ncbi:MAG: dihydroorotate dehydrogenase electron transfer subunit [Candidatus Omnitrophota bacterium]
MIKQVTAGIISNREIKPNYFLMEINAPAIAGKAKPGQFITLRCAATSSPLLRRPFCFHKISRNGFQILYEVVGKGTAILSNMRSGERIDILGPIGNGFKVMEKRKDFILICGGIGVAPLVALAEVLAKKRQNKIYAIIGARNKETLLCERDLKRLGIKTFLATDDGSQSFKGSATGLLENLLSTMDYRLWTIYACGPEAMYKTLYRIVEERDLECYVSLEENIACGVGACLGCAIKTKGGNKLICKDGPVFNIREIIWR